MKKLFTLLLGIGVPIFAFADTLEVAGAEMTYAYKGNNRYEVDLSIYTKCNQHTFDPVYIMLSTPGGMLPQKKVQATVKNMGEIPMDCHTDHHHVTTCENPASQTMGFRKWTATAEFTLYIAQACEYVFSWQACCRTSLITSGAANEPFYIEAYADICAGNISSPQFAGDFQPYLGKDKCATKKNSANGSLGSGFTYKYELTPPKKSQTASATFSNPYTKNH